MDGLFELLIILAIFLFPALEAWAKKRRQRRRGEENGEGEGVGGPTLSSEGPKEGRRPRAGRERERAEVLLPEDLWEELTGGRTAERPGEEATGQPDDGRTSPVGTAAEGAEEWTAPERELESAPPPAMEEWGGEAPPGADQERELSGLGAESYTEGAPEGLGEEVGGFPEPEEPRRADVLEGMDAARARRSGRRSVEGAGGRLRAGGLARLRPGRLARRGAPPAHARKPHPLVGELDREALRRAVVYREILGPPLALRDE